jgi:hypothetical protein
MADLKPVYRADTKQAAEMALDELEAKWGINTRKSFVHGVKNGIYSVPISNIRKR